MISVTATLLLGDTDSHGAVVWKEFASGHGDTRDTDSVKRLVQSRGGDAGDVELAVTGKAFAALTSAGEMEGLVLHTRIFARMSPAQKVETIALHQARKLVVAMCGDGGNDCGALRLAHVGLALSEAEASLVSPFTSRSKSCVSCVDLLREGRGALATSFASYRFLMQYGCGFSLLKLIGYWYGVIMSAVHYIFIDIIIVIIMTWCITLARPRPTLGTDRPTASLLGATTVCSVCGQHAINVCFLLGAIAWMNRSADYIQWGPNDDSVVPPRPVTTSEGRAWWYLGDNWEVTLLFTGFSFQLVTAAFVHSLGGRFRLPISRNHHLCFWTTALYALFACMLLLPPSTLTAVLHIASIDFNSPGTVNPVWQAYQEAGGLPSAGMSFDFRVKLFAIFATGNLTALLWETLVVQGPVRNALRRRYPPPSAARPLRL